MPKKEITSSRKSVKIHSGKNGMHKKLPGAANAVQVRNKPSGKNSSMRNVHHGDIILAGVANKPESHMTAMEKMDMVRIGISKNDLEHLKNMASLDYDELSKALSVTRATLINKKGKAKFNTALSERIVGLADIYSYGYSVFEDEDKFNKWMFRPNRALAGKAPYELIDNQFGREEVRGIIGRIDYGVYS